ncbi:MAG: NAD(P)H-binding protein, partial [Rhizobiales bacterium]|nr:NAD(P)H-binding protein [Hyphomicrobiales bacterium]
MTEQKRALVIGATGGVGGAVARALLAHGWRVRALQRDPAAARRKPGGDGIEWVRGDAMNPADVIAAAEGASILFHGANPPGGSIGDILNDILRNAGGGTQGAQSGSGGGGVGDILHQISQSLSQAQTKSPAGVSSQPGQGTASSSPDFGNILAQIRD